MAFVRAFFAVLASIITLVAVFAIKRGVEWELKGASDATLNLILGLSSSLQSLPSPGPR